MRARIATLIACVLTGILGLSMPTQGSAVQTPCLAAVYDAEAPGSATAAAACATGAGTGNVGAPPQDEYINLLTGVVFKQTPGGLAPVGMDVPQDGYVELTTVSHVGFVTHSPDLNGVATECDSTNPFVCLPASLTANTAGTYDCSAQVCESVHVAITGCSTVTLRFTFTGGWGPDSAPDVTYPCPARGGTGVPLPSSVSRIAAANADLPIVGDQVTLVVDAFPMEPGCWYYLSPSFVTHGDPQDPPRDAISQIPEDLWTFLDVDGHEVGHTHVQIC